MAEMDVGKVVEQVDNDPRVRVNEDGTKTVILSTPVVFGKREITEVKFRKPKGRDWRDTDKVSGELSKGFSLAASLSDLPMSVFDDMDGEEALLCATVAGTMGKKSQTGGT